MNRKLTVVYMFLLFLLALTANSNSLYGQGKLNRVRKAVRQEKPAKPKRDDDSHDEKSDRDKRKADDRRESKQQRNRKPNRKRYNNSNSGFGFVIGNLITPTIQDVHVIHHTPAAILSAPVVAPDPIFIADPMVTAQPETTYQPVVAPVANHLAPESQYFAPTGPSFDWGIRLSAVGGTDFDDIVLGNFGLLLQIPGGPGIDTSVAILRESGTDFRDHLYLGDVNVVFEPIHSDLFRMRFGVGVNWLGDAYGGDAGFNMTCGFDLKLTDRLLATAEVDFGSIGDTDLTHAQISLGRTISQRTEWAIGYDYRDIGGVTIGSAFTGLRFRF